MVAVINTGHSVRSIFNYNENKVREGAAECIGEGNYPMDVSRMDSAMKLGRLLRQNALNGNVKRGSVHISLNFHPSENYSPERLMEIAHAYMEKIGFAEQPYLVYRHHDAGHPHIHLVSIKVRPDGSRIDMQNIGRNQSEKARKGIEKDFGLVRAGDAKVELFSSLKPVPAAKVQYGKMESKKAISAVLHSVVSSYKYTSLAELNAVLQLYNNKEDRGSDNSRVSISGGLLYRIGDGKGKPIGVPIKASDFPMRPTLAFLERKFAVNNAERAFEKKRIRSAVDSAFFGRNLTLDRLVPVLEKKGINAVMRKSDAGLLYGLTFVDHVTRCVFNGSALGRNYSAKAVLERCGKPAEQQQPASPEEVFQKRMAGGSHQSSEEAFGGINGKVLDGLMKPEWQGDCVSAKFKGRRKKRKRKGRSDLN